MFERIVQIAVVAAIIWALKTGYVASKTMVSNAQDSAEIERIRAERKVENQRLQALQNAAIANANAAEQRKHELELEKIKAKQPVIIIQGGSYRTDQVKRDYYNSTIRR